MVVVAALTILFGVAAAIGTASDEDWPLVAALGFLFVAAENRDRVFSDETGLSGSIAVGLAASYYFATDGWLMGAFLIGALGGLYVPHARSIAVSKIVINGACFGLSALSATALLILVASSSWVLTSIVLVAATLVYWVANSCLLGFATAVLGRSRVVREIASLIRSDTVMLVFGLGGALCGVVMVEIGTWVGVATLIALLVTLDVFVISVPAGLANLRAAGVMLVTRGVSGGVAGTAGAIVTRGVAVSVLGALAGLAVGLAAGMAVVAIVVAFRMFVRYGRADLQTLGGLLIVESIVPLVAAVCGVVTAIAGVDVGLLVGSALVVIACAVVAAVRHRASTKPVVADEDELMAAVVEAMMDGLPARER